MDLPSKISCCQQLNLSPDSQQHLQTKKRALAPELLASFSNRSEIDSSCIDKNHVALAKENQCAEKARREANFIKVNVRPRGL
jgi:hypothetical protein